jgi:hypothetical protein
MGIRPARLVVVGVLVLAVVSCASRTATTGPNTSSTATSLPATSLADPAPLSSTPPAADSPAGHGLVISPTAVPESGGNLVFAVLDDDPDPAVFGVDGELDRWVDNRWQPCRSFAAAVSFWAFDGELAPAGSPALAPAIGLATDHGVGPLEWLHLDSTPAGWYRLRQGGGAAVFGVQAGSFATPWDDGTDHLPGLVAEPAVIAAGAQVLDIVAMGGDGQQNTVIGAPAGPVEVQRWSDTVSTWTPVADLAVDAHPEPAVDGAGEFAVDLPALPPGSYRLTAQYPALGELTGPLLVTAP